MREPETTAMGQSPEDLVEALRQARRAQRKLKKARMREARANLASAGQNVGQGPAAAPGLSPPAVPLHDSWDAECDPQSALSGGHLLSDYPDHAAVRDHAGVDVASVGFTQSAPSGGHLRLDHHQGIAADHAAVWPHHPQDSAADHAGAGWERYCLEHGHEIAD